MLTLALDMSKPLEERLNPEDHRIETQDDTASNVRSKMKELIGWIMTNDPAGENSDKARHSLIDELYNDVIDRLLADFRECVPIEIPEPTQTDDDHYLVPFADLRGLILPERSKRLLELFQDAEFEAKSNTGYETALSESILRLKDDRKYIKYARGEMRTTLKAYWPYLSRIDTPKNVLIEADELADKASQKEAERKREGDALDDNASPRAGENKPETVLAINEIVASGFQEGQTIYASMLGNSFRGESDITVRYMLLPAINSRWQIGRVVTRITTLAVCRLMALRHLSEFRKVGAQLQQAGIDLDEIEAELAKEDKKFDLKRLDIRSLVDSLNGQTEYLINQNQQYMNQFQMTVQHLNEKKIAGFQSYEEFTSRRLNRTFQAIEALSPRITRLRNRAANLRQRKEIQDGMDNLDQQTRMARAAEGVELVAVAFAGGTILTYWVTGFFSDEQINAFVPWNANASDIPAQINGLLAFLVGLVYYMRICIRQRKSPCGRCSACRFIRWFWYKATLNEK